MVMDEGHRVLRCFGAVCSPCVYVYEYTTDYCFTSHEVASLDPLFFLLDFIDLLERERERESARASTSGGRGRGRRESQANSALSTEPDVGLDPTTPRS